MLAVICFVVVSILSSLGTILASLYWSYTAMQIPAGLLCVKYGGSFLMGIAIFGSSLLTLATPFIVRQNVYAFIFVRMMEGAFLVSKPYQCLYVLWVSIILSGLKKVSCERTNTQSE